jgi:hypothetical protein
MKYRKLRITWSVAWGVVAVLLCVLWVRSYWYVDTFSLGSYGNTHWLGSISGELRYAKPRGQAHSLQWNTLPRESLRRESPRGSILGFRGVMISSGIPIVPHWFPLTIFTTLATVPWIKWRFSLRALLIATTLVAVVLGLVVWASR